MKGLRDHPALGGKQISLNSVAARGKFKSRDGSAAPVEHLPFEEAREFVRGLGLRSQADWSKYVKSGEKPNNIPPDPRRYYLRRGWMGLPDFLGYEYDYSKPLPGTKRKFLPFAEARDFARTLGLNSGKEWYEYWGQNKRPDNIPGDPRSAYMKSGWLGFPDFLGYTTDRPTLKDRYN